MQRHIKDKEELIQHNRVCQLYVVEIDNDGNILYASYGETSEQAQKNLEQVKGDYYGGRNPEGQKAMSDMAREHWREIEDKNTKGSSI